MNVRMQEISENYSRCYTDWKAFLGGFCARIGRLLEDDQQRFSVKYRVKSFESLSEKEAYLLRQGKEPLIKDLLGMRVVVPFQEGVEQVISLLHRHFEIQEIERKSEQLSFREFAYDSVHVEIPVEEDLGLPSLCKHVVEVQVRTILQDAWAEVEHELIYKNHFRFPNNESIRKKLAALNANLTLSDMIFQEIRDYQKEMEKWGKDRFKALIDKAVDIEQASVVSGPQHEGDSKGSQQADSATGKLPGADVQADTDNLASRAEIEKHMMAALKAHNEHDYRTAIHFYSLVLDCNPELKVRSVVFSHRGMAHFMLQQESQALSDFDRSFYCDRSNYRSLNYRAMVLRRMGYVEEALECFASSLDIRENQAEVYLLRSQTLFEIAEDEEAMADLQKALELDPANEDARRLYAEVSDQGNAG